jgi:hypothetical protein
MANGPRVKYGSRPNPVIGDSKMNVTKPPFAACGRQSAAFPFLTHRKSA